MFNNKKIKELEERIYRLENPFLFGIEDEDLIFSFNNKLRSGKIWTRYWAGKRKFYTFEGGYIRIEESEIFKFNDIKENIKEQICGSKLRSTNKKTGNKKTAKSKN